MSDLFTRISHVVGQVPGWCTPEKAQALAALVIGYRPKTVLEIGVFGGSSFFPFALAMQALNHEGHEGVVIGCDPWDKNIAIAAQVDEVSRKWWDEVNLEQIYQDFIQRISAWALNDACVIERIESRFVRPPPNLGILHVDGAHNDEAVKDVMRFSYSLMKGGFIILDDLGWTGGGVTRAEMRLLQLNYIKLYTIGTGAVYQKL